VTGRCKFLLWMVVGLQLQCPAIAHSHETAALNVSISVFEAGVPADPSVHRDLRIFPRIREVEARFLPFVLRETLADTGHWGAVRVVPEPDPATEVAISGSIIRSDGERLELRVRAVDATGRVWFERHFESRPADAGALSANADTGSPYQPLYDEIARVLRASREQLNDRELQRIAEVSLMRYAAELAPSAFGQYIAEDADGRYSLQRLPARSDPMLERIERIRLTEYVITDTVDAKFRELHGEIASTYALWRDYRRKSVEYDRQNAEHAQATSSDVPRGSYDALKTLYDNYKWDRVTAQEQDRLAIAFNNEVGPVVEAMEARIDELENWVDAKYAEWHGLLEELFEVETELNQATSQERGSPRD